MPAKLSCLLVQVHRPHSCISLIFLFDFPFSYFALSFSDIMREFTSKNNLVGNPSTPPRLSSTLQWKWCLMSSSSKQLSRNPLSSILCHLPVKYTSTCLVKDGKLYSLLPLSLDSFFGCYSWWRVRSFWVQHLPFPYIP